MTISTARAIDALATGETLAPASYDGTLGFSDIIINGETFARRVRNDRVVEYRNAYRAMFPGTRIDIVETETLGVTNDRVFAGTPETFSHVSSHDTDAPMFDVHIDGACVARNLDFTAALTVITDSVDVIDIFSAIAEALVSPEFSFSDVMSAVQSMSAAQFRGVTLVRRNVVHNDAPSPTVPTGYYDGQLFRHDAWRGNRKVRRINRKTRVYETRVSGVPRSCIADPYVVLSRADLSVLFTGAESETKEYARQYIERRGHYLRDITVQRLSTLAAYRATVESDGYRVMSHGSTIAIGTRADIDAFLRDGIAQHHLNPDELSIRSMS